METKITTGNSEVIVKDEQIIINPINQGGLSKKDVISAISEYQAGMIGEIKQLDQLAEKDRLMANLIRGHINAASNIMKIISKL